MLTYNKSKYNSGKEASNEPLPGLLGRQLGIKEIVLVPQLNHCTLFYCIYWSCLWKLTYFVFQRFVWNTECQQLQPLNVINRRVWPWPIPGKVWKSQPTNFVRCQWPIWGKAELPSHLWLLSEGCCWPRLSSWTPFMQKTGRPARAHLSSVGDPLLGMLLRRHQLSAHRLDNQYSK